MELCLQVGEEPYCPNVEHVVKEHVMSTNDVTFMVYTRREGHQEMGGA